ncbi:hypothetical protein HY988_01880 [Candidatus Micrarchaeota archaeon]|nr:hypothetical protein [Candidatus Micrarchaeota archaeon]
MGVHLTLVKPLKRADVQQPASAQFSSLGPALAGSMGKTRLGRFEAKLKAAVENAAGGNHRRAGKLLDAAQWITEKRADYRGAKILQTAQEIVQDGLRRAMEYAEGKRPLNSFWPAKDDSARIGHMAQMMDVDVEMVAEMYGIESGSSCAVLLEYIENLGDFADSFGIEIKAEKIQETCQKLVDRRLEILLEQVGSMKYSPISTEEKFEECINETEVFAQWTGCELSEEKLGILLKAAKRSWAIECLIYATFGGEWKEQLEYAQACAKEAGLRIKGRVRKIEKLRSSKAEGREWMAECREYYLAEARTPVDQGYAPLYLAFAKECAIYAGIAMADTVLKIGIIPQQSANNGLNRLSVFYAKFKYEMEY